jgi:membrane protein
MADGPSVLSVSLHALARRVWNATNADDVTGLAAEMSYYFVLSVFPFLIFLAAVVGTLPFTNAWGGMLKWILLYFPRDSQGLVFQIVLSLTQDRRSFLSLGLLGSAWAATSGLMSLMAALNTVYEVQETRSYAKRLGLASLMVLVLALLLLSTFALLTAGNWVDQWLAASSMGLVSALALWRMTRWIASVILLGVGIGILDHIMPNLQRPWRRIRPGVAFTVVGWLVASAGVNFYAKHLSTFNKTYGVLGVFIILMVWIYLVSVVTLVGAEINSELGKMTSQTAVSWQRGAVIKHR